MFAFKREYEGTSLYTVFNTADTPILADFTLDLPGRDNPHRPIQYGGTTQLTVGNDGRVLAPLPAREAMILTISPEASTAPVTPSAEITLTTDLTANEISESVTLEGVVSVPSSELMLVDQWRGGRGLDLPRRGRWNMGNHASD
ncbi:MAG UNVERIFIED_CONTAM: hypothetical protein LVT10_09255 [Anaerolineae bacterium]